MKKDVAIITTDGEATKLPMPVAISKVQEVADGLVHFSAHEDELIAAWMLKINEILVVR